MSTPSLAEWVADAWLPAVEWADRRLQERSTLIGVAGWLVTLGFAGLGAQVTSHLDLIVMVAGIVNTALITTSTKPLLPELIVAPAIHAIVSPAIAAEPRAEPPARAAPPPRPMPVTSTPTKGNDMSLISVARKLFGVIAVAVAPTWSKAIANSLAQAEATLVPILGDDAKKLCEDAAATGVGGFEKLGNVVHDLYNIAVTKGIKADYMVLTVIAAKAYAQVKANAPELLDVAIETGISAAAGPAVGALTAPVVEAGVAAATAGLSPAAAA